MKSIKVLIVDDQKLFAECLKRVLEEESEIVDASVASNGAEALVELDRGGADVVLLDISMPVMNGIETTRKIRLQFPETKVLMLTTFGYDEYVKAALEKGAVGYLLKDISSSELLAAIKAAMDGVRVVSPQILRGFSSVPTHIVAAPAPVWLRELTQRERDILLFVMKGYSNEEIADRLFLGLQTVKNYLHKVYAKLGVKNRFQAMRLAMEVKLDTLVDPT